MTYQESAEPLTFKQKAKRAAIVISYLFVFAFGGVTIPLIQEGWDLTIAPLYETKPFVAPKSDVEIEIEKYLMSSDYQKEIKAEAEGRVKLMIATRLGNEAQDAAIKADQYEMRALNGISSETATQTIKIETKQGRR